MLTFGTILAIVFLGISALVLLAGILALIVQEWSAAAGLLATALVLGPWREREPLEQ